ncbi:MAG: metallophosphoesterase [Leptospirales bacterium]|nr:metallophosphoesterase [Leptospirales bacterium]
MWIIGDIHGCLEELEELLHRIPAQDPLLFLGDYIDRGPSASGVIARVMREKHRSHYLLGNHESMMLNYFQDPASDEGRSWLHPLNGGQDTLKSYGLSSGSTYQSIPVSHRQFLETLELSFENQDFIAVHAGLDPTRDLAHQDRQTLLWIREEWIRAESHWTGKRVYYGHTPTRYVNGLMNQKDPIRGKRSIGLDTGCVFGGFLTAMNAYTDELIQISAKRNYWH